MSDQLTFEQFWTLRAEAEEARRLASSFTDRQTIIDLERYASELETEAAKSHLEQEPSGHGQFADLGTIIWGDAHKRPTHAQE